MVDGIRILKKGVQYEVLCRLSSSPQKPPEEGASGETLWI